MARSSYSRVVRGFPDLGDPRLVEEFEGFSVECRGDGGTVQIRASRDGDFELTCSILEVGDGFGGGEGHGGD